MKPTHGFTWAELVNLFLRCGDHTLYPISARAEPKPLS
jgi:hypothetical protein